MTHWKRPWCWERLKMGGKGDDRGGDGWMASPTQWTWVWVSSGSWWWTGKPGCCSPWGCKEPDVSEWLNWTELGPTSYFMSHLHLVSSSYGMIFSYRMSPNNNFLKFSQQQLMLKFINKMCNCEWRREVLLFCYHALQFNFGACNLTNLTGNSTV